MEPRKVLLTIEVLTDLRKNDFKKVELQELFDGYKTELGEKLEIHQVTFQVVKEDK